MPVYKFDMLLNEACLLFRHANDERLKKTVACNMLKKCTSDFEEVCLIERLKEELRP